MRSILERNLRVVRDRIERAARAAGRSPAEVELLAVTKSVGAEAAAALFELGQRDLGENRVDGLEAKHAHFAERGLVARWHFIGHLQRNKARRVVRLADEIHSVDSLRLVEALERLAAEEGRRPAVYLQVDVARERQKHGLAPEELPAAARAAAAAEHLALVGLMTMAPLVDEPGRSAAARATFRGLAELARGLPPELFPGPPRLSMGMSGDLEEAVAEGSHLVRVGTALFEGLPAERS